MILNSNLLLLSYICSYIFIYGYLKLNIFYQEISQFTNHQHKQHTPSSGGIPMFFAGLLCIIIYAFILHINIINDVLYVKEYAYVICVILLFFIIGLIDDIFKKIYRSNKGLSFKLRIIIEIIGLSLITLILNENIYMYLFYIFIVFSSANAFNISDGMDELMINVSLIALIFLIFVSSLTMNNPFMPLLIVSLGCLFGIYVFNINPARIFLGDSGSLSLGALTSSISIALDSYIGYGFIIIIPIINAFSVFIQLLSYKLFKYRPFGFTPLHHYFELFGIHERLIVNLISAVTITIGFIVIAKNYIFYNFYFSYLNLYDKLNLFNIFHKSFIIYFLLSIIFIVFYTICSQNIKSFHLRYAKLINTNVIDISKNKFNIFNIGLIPFAMILICTFDVYFNIFIINNKNIYYEYFILLFFTIAIYVLSVIQLFVYDKYKIEYQAYYQGKYYLSFKLNICDLIFSLIYSIMFILFYYIYKNNFYDFNLYNAISICLNFSFILLVFYSICNNKHLGIYAMIISYLIMFNVINDKYIAFIWFNMIGILISNLIIPCNIKTNTCQYEYNLCNINIFIFYLYFINSYGSLSFINNVSINIIYIQIFVLVIYILHFIIANISLIMKMRHFRDYINNIYNIFDFDLYKRYALISFIVCLIYIILQ